NHSEPRLHFAGPRRGSVVKRRTFRRSLAERPFIELDVHPGVGPSGFRGRENIERYALFSEGFAECVERAGGSRLDRAERNVLARRDLRIAEALEEGD